MIRRALALFGRALDRALTWCMPITSMRLDSLTCDDPIDITPDEGE